MQESTRQAITFLHQSHLLLIQALGSLKAANRHQPCENNEALVLNVEKSVDDVVGYMRYLLEPEYPNVWVEGEGFDMKLLQTIILVPPTIE